MGFFPAGSTHRERLARVRWWIGVGAVVLVVFARWTGLRPWAGAGLAVEDHWARTLDGGASGVSGDVLVFAIDDNAVDEMGQWPWDRSVLAGVIDELTRGGARTVAIDLLLDQARNEGLFAAGSGSLGDRRLGEAIGAHPGVVLASNFTLTASERDVRGFDAVAGLLRGRGALLTEPSDMVVATLRREGGAVDGLSRSEVARWVRVYQSIAACREWTVVPERARDWPVSSVPRPPGPEFVSGASRLGNVTLYGSRDGDEVLRRIPSFVVHDGRLWGSLGLSAVMAHVGADATGVAVGGRGVVIGGTGAGAPHRLRLDRGGGSFGSHRVTWPKASRGWEDQFDVGEQPGIVSIMFLLRAALAEAQIRENIAALEPIGRWLSATADPTPGYSGWVEFLLASEVLDDAWASRFGRLREHMELVSRYAAAEIKAVDAAAVREMDDESLGRFEEWRYVAEETPRLLHDIDRLRELLLERRLSIGTMVQDRLCFIGWVATGAAVDVVATPIHGETPGVVVHAAVANSVLTGRQLRSAPGWLWFGFVALIGMAGAVLAARAPVWLVLAGVGGLLLLVFIVVAASWSWSMRVLDASDAIAACMLASGGVLVHRLVSEQRARRLTERRFRSYVSPQVVDILVDDPSLASMRPRSRELTVLFADVEGFTPLAERLGAQRTGEVLNELMSSLTGVLHEHRATLDKYLGDGLMAFWGAPISNESHAAEACLAALAMSGAIEGGTFGGESVALRVGLASGELMVGDFGDPPRRSSYTVVGDAANLASRLEGLNKVLGTRVLASARTRELAGEGFEWMYIGRVRVRGRSGAGPVHALLGPAFGLSDEDRERQRLVAGVVGALAEGGDGGACEAALRDYEGLFGVDGLAKAYRDAMGTSAGGDADGTIDLSGF